MQIKTQEIPLKDKWCGLVVFFGGGGVLGFAVFVLGFFSVGLVLFLLFVCFFGFLFGFF